MSRMATRLGLPALGFLLLLQVLGGLALHVPGSVSVGSIGRVNLFVAVLAAAAACYLAACAIVVRDGGDRRTLWLVLAVALLLRVPVLAAPPFLSSDLYRYVWDGRVQEAGINPYRYIPADPALRFLRDDAIYPHVNRRDYAPTIYPPTAQLLFRLMARIGQTPLSIRLAMVGCEALAVLCLWRLLRLAALPPARVLVYAWNPLAVWCFAGNGHVDALAVGLVALTLLCRGKRRDGLAGAVFGAAILVKFLPVVIAAAIWRPWRWRMPIAAAATMVALYGCYLDVGTKVFGFLSAYGTEEGLSRGSGIWILAGLGRLATLPPWSVGAYVVLIAAGLGTWALLIALPRRSCDRQGRDIVRTSGAAGLMAAAVMLLLSPHYPWYFPFLGVFGVIAPYACVIWMSVAPLVLYLSPWHEFFLWPSLVYAPALVLAVLDLRRRAARPFPLLVAPSAAPSARNLP